VYLMRGFGSHSMALTGPAISLVVLRSVDGCDRGRESGSGRESRRSKVAEEAICREEVNSSRKPRTATAWLWVAAMRLHCHLSLACDGNSLNFACHTVIARVEHFARHASLKEGH
jgi:hypothetical protein